jgi:hypothetical protein
MDWKNPRLLLLAAVGSVSTPLYLQDFTLATYLWVFFPLCGLYVLALVAILRKRTNVSYLPLIIGFALVFRLILVFSPLVLSSDLYRYVWDGRVQRAGLNPYRYPPEAEALTALRDTEIFPRVHRPWLPTIYPPAAQMFFALSASVFPDSISGMKALLMLGDGATLLLLVRLLKRTGSDPDRVLVYAWSPLVLFELAGSGHVEALMLPFVLLALLACRRDQPLLAGAALGIATLVKLYPAVLFPALYRKRDVRFPLAFGATVLLGYLPYAPGGKFLGYLPGYFGHWEDFNIGLRHWLTVLLTLVTPHPRLTAMLVLTAVLLAVALSVDRRADVCRGAYVMAAAYLILLPTSFHPWYLVWLLPFLCLYPSWGWLYLSGAIALSYLHYVEGAQPPDVRLLAFLPCYALLLAQAVWRRFWFVGHFRYDLPLQADRRRQPWSIDR